MLLLFHEFLQFIQPILVPTCFVLAWVFTIALGSTLWGSIRDAINRAKTMHEIPCASCRFFTNDHRLKCTVRPNIANTEQAISCSDFSAKRY
jgi:hypothetical protein